MKLIGQVAIVTGAGRGFGQAIAQHLARAGAKVVLGARSAHELATTVSSIEAEGGAALAVPADVTSAGDVDKLVRAAADRFGPVTLLVSNAGTGGPFGPIWEVDPVAWWRTHEVHTLGAFLCTRAVLPGMIASGGGRVLTISSIAAKAQRPFFSAYAVSKASQARFTELLAIEGKPHGVSAFAIHPGTALTAMACETLASPDIGRWAPGLITMLEKSDRERGQADLARCAELCVELASGRWDALSGRFVTIDDDLATLT